MSQPIKCPVIIKSGNRKGQACNRDCYPGREICSFHVGVNTRVANKEERMKQARQMPEYAFREIGFPQVSIFHALYRSCFGCWN